MRIEKQNKQTFMTISVTEQKAWIHNIFRDVHTIVNQRNKINGEKNLKKDWKRSRLLQHETYKIQIAC